jgi:hypothetical protein
LSAILFSRNNNNNNSSLDLIINIRKFCRLKFEKSQTQTVSGVETTETFELPQFRRLIPADIAKNREIVA